MGGRVTNATAVRVGRDTYLAARVLNALIREDVGGLAGRLSWDKAGAYVPLSASRRVRMAPGFPSGGLEGLFQDFTVAAGERLRLREVLATLGKIADPADAEGVAAFREECRQTLTGLELLDRHRASVEDRLPELGPIGYEVLAAFTDHPVYPTARCRHGLTEEQLLAYAPEFAPRFTLRWAAVPGTGPVPEFFPSFAAVGLPAGLAATHRLFPVHPLSLPQVSAVVAPLDLLPVRPTLSMRTVEVSPRTHLKMPLATATLGARNRRSIKPGVLDDGARAERLLAEVLDRHPGMRVCLAGEQEYAHSGNEFLAWMARRLPEGEIVSVAALSVPGVLGALADRHYRGDQEALLADYLTALLTWNVTLFVRYGIALEAHQQNLALVFGDGPMRLLIKDNDGLLASPDHLHAAGITVPGFSDERMLTGDPHALADVFVTITLHLAAAAVTLRPDLVRAALASALDEHGDHPMARLLRNRTLEAARLVGKSMVTAGSLVSKTRSGAKDINKFYGTSGPNYLRKGSPGPCT